MIVVGSSLLSKLKALVDSLIRIELGYFHPETWELLGPELFGELDGAALFCKIVGEGLGVGVGEGKTVA